MNTGQSPAQEMAEALNEMLALADEEVVAGWSEQAAIVHHLWKRGGVAIVDAAALEALRRAIVALLTAPEEDHIAALQCVEMKAVLVCDGAHLPQEGKTP